MKNWKFRIAFSVLGAAFVTTTYWIGGGDFVRGYSLMVAYVMAVFAAVAGLTCPLMDRS